MAGRVIVVGSVNVDLVVRVARLPRPGETVIATDLERHHGGKGGNQAVAAARLGRPTVFIGAVGDDDFGAQAMAALAAEGIDVAAVSARPGQATGVALILVDPAGENQIAVAAGANHGLEPATVEEALAGLGNLAGDVVLVSCEVPQPAVRGALLAARRAGARTILNPAPATDLPRSVLGLADIVTPNAHEMAALLEAGGGRAGRRPVRAATAARHLLGGDGGPGPGQAIVVTLGSAGVILVEREPAGAVQATPARRLPAMVVEAADATGAGDTFNGALAAALAGGWPPLDATRVAVAAAALAVTRVGAREGMPTAGELAAFLRARRAPVAWDEDAACRPGAPGPASG